MPPAIRATRRLVLALGIVGLGAPTRANGGDDAKHLPPAISWTRRDGPAGALLDLPPVGDQRHSFTCVSWAVRTVAAFHRRHMDAQLVGRPPSRGPRNREYAPSVTYLNNLALRRSACRGSEAATSACDPSGTFAPANLTTDVDGVLTTLQAFGAPTEATTPFTTNVAAVPSEELRQEAARHRCCWQAALVRSDPSTLVGEALTAPRLAEALARGPLVAMMNVFTDFGCEGGDVYVPRDSDTNPAQLRGRHALVIVGYEPSRGDDGPCFQFMNSWGDWRDHGMVWIPFSRFGAHPAARPDAGLGNPLGTRVIDAVWLFEPPAEQAKGPPERPTCDPCTKAPALPADFFYGPPTVDGQAWRDDGLVVKCGEVPVLRLAAPSGPTDPDPDRPGAAAGPHVEPIAVAIERVKGASRTLVAPQIPLIPALFDAKIRYFVGPLSDAGSARDRRPPELLKPVDERTLGYRFRHVGLGADRRASADLGPDPTAIGAFADRARFEITDETRVSGKPILVRIEVSYPGDDPRAQPRLVREYVVTVAP